MLTAQVFMDYLQQHGAFHGPPNVILLKSGMLSDAYVNQRIFADEEKHAEMLRRIGDYIMGVKAALDVDIVVGIKTTGAIFAKYADSDHVIFNPHDGNTLSGDISGKRVLIVDDTSTTGSSIKKAIESCRDAGTTVVGVLVTVRRDKNVTAESLELGENGKLIVLANIGFDIVTEDISTDELFAASTLVQGLIARKYQMREDVGYAAIRQWRTLVLPDIIYVGEPTVKG